MFRLKKSPKKQKWVNPLKKGIHQIKDSCCLSLKGSTYKALAVSCIFTCTSILNAEPIKALVVSGGTVHDYRVQSKILSEQISNYSKIDIEWTLFTGTSGGRSGMSIFNQQGWADEYDIVIYNVNKHDSDNAYIDRILEPHRNGKPAILIHAATISWRGQVAGSDWAELQGVHTNFRHNAREEFDMNFLDFENDIVKAIGGEWTTRHDEMFPVRTTPNNYPESLTPLSEALHRGSRDTRMNIWTNIYRGQTRVVATTLGHFNANLNDPKFGKMLTSSLLWATGNPVEGNMNSDADLAHKYEFEVEFETYAKNNPSLIYDEIHPDNVEDVNWYVSRPSRENQKPIIGWGVIELNNTNSYVRIPDVDFETGTEEINIKYASRDRTNTFEIRRGSLYGPVIADLNLPSTGTEKHYETITVPLEYTEGKHDLFIVSKNGSRARYDYFTLNTPESSPLPLPDEDTVKLWNMLPEEMGNGDLEIELLNGAMRDDTSGLNQTDGLVFNGGDQVARISGPTFESGQSFSIDTWIKFTDFDTTTSQRIFLKYNNRLKSGFILSRTTSGRWVTYIGNGTSREIRSTQPLAVVENQWHHIALTWNQETQVLTFWLDGTPNEFEMGDDFVFMDNASTDLYIGNDQWESFDRYHFIGCMDTLHISKVARTYQPTTTTPLTLDVLTSYSSSEYYTWENNYSIVTGQAGDQDGDGINNETEFFFGMDPTSNNNLHRPTVDKSGPSPVITYTYPEEALNQVNYILERSYNGLDWVTMHTNNRDGRTYPEALQGDEPNTIGGGLNTITVESNQTYHQQPQQVFRLRVVE